VASISSNSHAHWAYGKTVLSIFLNGVVVTYSTLLMAQNLDASVSNLMCVRRVIKSASDAELHVLIFLHDCT
jgi:hypothetical protein